MKNTYTLLALTLLLTHAPLHSPAAAQTRRAPLNAGAQSQAPRGQSATPQRGAAFDFPGQVLQHKGQLPYSIRKVLGDSDQHFGATEPNTAEGHRYFSLNSLGRADLSPEQVMRAVARDLNVVFPINARGTCGQRVEVGNEFVLSLKLGGHEFRQNPVVVTDKSPYYFTVATRPGHTFKGKLTHGFVKDGAGELWMFQDGTGVAGQESVALIETNYDAAKVMWREMADRVRRLMSEVSLDGGDEEGPEPGLADVSRVVLVNGYVNTRIQVRCGDTVGIRASGYVTFGAFAGRGGPEGIAFNNEYNYFKDMLHGCLIGRVSRADNGGWRYVGRGGQIVAEEAGVLEFDVNDNDPGNNVDAFTVVVVVRRAR